MSIPSILPKRSLGLKLILVCGLVLLMAIPAMFISYISFERSGRADTVTQEVSKRYGGEQYIGGPVLVVPYFTMGSENKHGESGHYLISPEDGLASFTDIKTVIKKRSLFKVPIYTAKGMLSARFEPIDMDQIGKGRILDWSQAKIVISLTDGRGLKEDIYLTDDRGQSYKFEPDTKPIDVSVAFEAVTGLSMTGTGFQHHRSLGGQILSVPAEDFIQSAEAFEVQAELEIGGASRLGFYPFAKSTVINIASDWASPGFQGGFAPVEQDISKTGFSARWSVPYLARGIQAQGPSHQLGLLSNVQKAMTVQFVSEVNPYQTVNRALKYSVMFIGLVFVTFFLFETLIGKPVHAAQYILIGLAQTIFYLLLLAFSEHVGFALAFFIAAFATTGLTAAYAGAVFGERRYAIQAGGVFAMTYSLLFGLMRMQDFALLIGALASFAAVALTMYFTRNVDWYDASRSVSKSPKDVGPQT